MSKRTVVWGSMVGVVALVSGVLVLAGGCQKEKPVARQQVQPMEKMPAHEHAAMDQAAGQAVAAAAEQTTCPVMGGAINKDIFVEYQGKKVYFCCKDCVEKFKAHPEWYLDKLPQFAKAKAGSTGQ